MNEMEERIARLERSVRRGRWGTAASCGALLVMLCTSAMLRSAEVVRADMVETGELRILAEDGTCRAKLHALHDSAELVITDGEGEERLSLGESRDGPGGSRLELWSEEGVSIRMDANDRTANLLLDVAADDDTTSLWATCGKGFNRLSFGTPGGSSCAVIGVTEEEAVHGGFLSLTDYRRARTPDGEEVWATEGTYFLVSPTERVDRR